MGCRIVGSILGVPGLGKLPYPLVRVRVWDLGFLPLSAETLLLPLLRDIWPLMIGSEVLIEGMEGRGGCGVLGLGFQSLIPTNLISNPLTLIPDNFMLYAFWMQPSEQGV